MGGRRGACGARPRRRWTVVAPHRRCGGHRRELPRYRWAAAGPSQASRSTTLNRMLTRHTVPVGGGRAWPGFEIDHSERSSRVAISRAGRRPPAHTAARPNKTGHAAARDLSGQRTTRSRPAPQGPGGSRVRPLGGSQRLFQRIWVPSEPRRWQASTTRAAMPASADLPHVRGSYCFFTPTSPSILRTPS